MKPLLPPKDPAVFEHSENPRELVRMAKTYAASDQPADQALLLRQLGSARFLKRLNPEIHYVALEPRTLEVAAIVKSLMDQPHAAARQTLVGLTQCEAFQAYPSLIELNIRALAADRPASPRTIAYWDKHSDPKCSTTVVVMDAIFTNRTEPALRLFEAKMNDPKHDAGLKRYWLRDQLLRARNNPQVLAFCESTLTKRTLDAKWHSALLEVLFDYSEKWYVSCKFPRPPARLAATAEARTTLGRIGRHALEQMQLFIPGLRAKIILVMKEIGQKWDEDRERPVG